MTNTTKVFNEMIKKYNLKECSVDVINQFIQGYDQLLLNAVKDIAGEEYSKGKMKKEIENRRKSHEDTEWPTEEMAKESLSNLKIAERELDKMDEAIEMKLLDIQYSIDMRDCFKSLIN